MSLLTLSEEMAEEYVETWPIEKEFSDSLLRKGWTEGDITANVQRVREPADL